MVVDQPKQGFGNTNDGNTARVAFENADVFSEITGVSVEAITRLRTVLIALNSGFPLSDKFEAYCQETSQYLVDNYGWYKIPPSVHKMLEHSSQAAAQFELPIGMYSEEAQESQNKVIINARLEHNAKISRKNVMTNQLHWLLIRSDPKISSISFKKHKNFGGKPLPQEVIPLLSM